MPASTGPGKEENMSEQDNGTPTKGKESGADGGPGPVPEPIRGRCCGEEGTKNVIRCHHFSSYEAIYEDSQEPCDLGECRHPKPVIKEPVGYDCGCELWEPDDNDA